MYPSSGGGGFPGNGQMQYGGGYGMPQQGMQGNMQNAQGMYAANPYQAGAQMPPGAQMQMQQQYMNQMPGGNAQGFGQFPPTQQYPQNMYAQQMPGNGQFQQQQQQYGGYPNPQASMNGTTFNAPMQQSGSNPGAHAQQEQQKHDTSNAFGEFLAFDRSHHLLGAKPSAKPEVSPAGQQSSSDFSSASASLPTVSATDGAGAGTNNGRRTSSAAMHYQAIASGTAPAPSTATSEADDFFSAGGESGGDFGDFQSADAGTSGFSASFDSFQSAPVANVSNGIQSTSMSSGMQFSNVNNGMEPTNMSSGMQSTNMSNGMQPTNVNISSGMQSTNVSNAMQSTNMNSGMQPTYMSSGMQSTNMSNGMPSTNYNGGMQTAHMTSGMQSTDFGGGMQATPPSQMTHTKSGFEMGGHPGGASTMPGMTTSGSQPTLPSSSFPTSTSSSSSSPPRSSSPPGGPATMAPSSSSPSSKPPKGLSPPAASSSSARPSRKIKPRRSVSWGNIHTTCFATDDLPTEVSSQEVQTRKVVLDPVSPPRGPGGPPPGPPPSSLSLPTPVIESAEERARKTSNPTFANMLNAAFAGFSSDLQVAMKPSTTAMSDSGAAAMQNSMTAMGGSGGMSAMQGSAAGNSMTAMSGGVGMPAMQGSAAGMSAMKGPMAAMGDSEMSSAMSSSSVPVVAHGSPAVGFGGASGAPMSGMTRPVASGMHQPFYSGSPANMQEAQAMAAYTGMDVPSSSDEFDVSFGEFQSDDTGTDASNVSDSDGASAALSWQQPQSAGFAPTATTQGAPMASAPFGMTQATGNLSTGSSVMSGNMNISGSVMSSSISISGSSGSGTGMSAAATSVTSGNTASMPPSSSTSGWSSDGWNSGTGTSATDSDGFEADFGDFQEEESDFGAWESAAATSEAPPAPVSNIQAPSISVSKQPPPPISAPQSTAPEKPLTTTEESDDPFSKMSGSDLFHAVSSSDSLERMSPKRQSASSSLENVEIGALEPTKTEQPSAVQQKPKEKPSVASLLSLYQSAPPAPVQLENDDAFEADFGEFQATEEPADGMEGVQSAQADGMDGELILSDTSSPDLSTQVTTVVDSKESNIDFGGFEAAADTHSATFPPVAPESGGTAAPDIAFDFDSVVVVDSKPGVTEEGEQTEGNADLPATVPAGGENLAEATAADALPVDSSNFEADFGEFESSEDAGADFGASEKAGEKVSEDTGGDFGAFEKASEDTAADFGAFEKASEDASGDFGGFEKASEGTGGDFGGFEKASEDTGGDFGDFENAGESSGGEFGAFESEGDAGGDFGEFVDTPASPSAIENFAFAVSPPETKPESSSVPPPSAAIASDAKIPSASDTSKPEKPSAPVQATTMDDFFNFDSVETTTTTTTASTAVNSSFDFMTAPDVSTPSPSSDATPLSTGPTAAASTANAPSMPSTASSSMSSLYQPTENTQLTSTWKNWQSWTDVDHSVKSFGGPQSMKWFRRHFRWVEKAWDSGHGRREEFDVRGLVSFVAACLCEHCSVTDVEQWALWMAVLESALHLLRESQSVWEGIQAALMQGNDAGIDSAELMESVMSSQEIREYGKGLSYALRVGYFAARSLLLLPVSESLRREFVLPAAMKVIDVVRAGALHVIQSASATETLGSDLVSLDEISTIENAILSFTELAPSSSATGVDVCELTGATKSLLSPGAAAQWWCEDEDEGTVHYLPALRIWQRVVSGISGDTDEEDYEDEGVDLTLAAVNLVYKRSVPVSSSVTYGAEATAGR